MELRFEMLALSRAKCLFDKPASVLAFTADESVRFHAALTVGRHDYLDRFQDAPPTLTVSLMEPSSSDCSVTE